MATIIHRFISEFVSTNPETVLKSGLVSTNPETQSVVRKQAKESWKEPRVRNKISEVYA
jgi:hypothetical protein